ncbi:PREDICTED: uncharacterized protein At5g41620 [Tarenaya hassleriana]|uniref:uncharacterized protein At5g41620 n=1 Tax=Tarenaya hassleriana TaxID=28532 RepID=UPI00053C59CA|nr:PREDICTED: uncharacterized protein At5g41620 [Tarenaya hassleriana]
MREEKVGERDCEGEGGGGEEMEKKWRHGLLAGNSYKRGGPSTPPPIWRLEFSPPPRAGAPASVESKEFLTNPAAAEVSARKLCANLWEVEQFRPPIMRRGLRKMRRVRRRDKVEDDEASDVEPPDGGPPHDHQALSTGGSRRQISATLGPNHRLVQTSGHAMEPVSRASYSSSLEAAACKKGFTPTDSLELKSLSYGLKTSTKLLKVLNRIWSLEEQNAANMSLVKALKTELDQCREGIKELQQEKHGNRGIDKIKGSKFTSRRMEQEQLKAAIQSIREELEDERKLRRRSESLHRKLGRELGEVKHCFAKTLKELERERRGRVLLENLCDEFAEAVKDYEDDIRRTGGKLSPVVEREDADRLIVHVAEAWLDERSQMKLQEDREVESLGKNSILDKLGLDIETFLRAKRYNDSRKKKKKSYLTGFEKRCSESKSRSLDLNKDSSRRLGKDSALRESSADSSDTVKQGVHSSKLEKVSNFQNPHENSDYHMATSNAQLSETEIRRDNQLHLLRDLYGRKSKRVGENHVLVLDQDLGLMIRNQSGSSEGDKIHPESTAREAEHLGCQDLDKSGTCSKQIRNVKEDSLEAKLMEARLESRRSRS